MKAECLPRLTALGIAEHDARELRRIAMTLHRWHELECGAGNDHGSWVLVRGCNKVNGGFTHDDDGAPFIEHHHYLHSRGKDYVSYSLVADREKGAHKRLARIMAGYPTLQFYIQGDPRGCALYILPPGLDAESYNRGVAVYK